MLPTWLPLDPRQSYLRLRLPPSLRKTTSPSSHIRWILIANSTRPLLYSQGTSVSSRPKFPAPSLVWSVKSSKREVEGLLHPSRKRLPSLSLLLATYVLCFHANFAAAAPTATMLSFSPFLALIDSFLTSPSLLCLLRGIERCKEAD